MEMDYSLQLGKSILSDIKSDLERKLTRCGIMYRIFARTKAIASLERKFKSKPKNYYSANGKKVQDVIGLRVVFYFHSDINPFCDSLKKEILFDGISDSEVDFKKQKKECERCEKNINVKFDEVFRPERLNLVFRMDDYAESKFREELQQIPQYSDLIDTTYEVQLRSVLSEGWHEVEHDLRYKFQNDWRNSEQESRMLNGIYGSLESHEYAMEMLFEKKARIHFFEHAWEAMLRNHIRLRMSGLLSKRIQEYFDKKPEAAKPFLKCERGRLVNALYNMKRSYILNYDNLIFLINRLQTIPNKVILIMEPNLVKEQLNSYFSVMPDELD